jgi:putative FmdB family regulatory protein
MGVLGGVDVRMVEEYAMPTYEYEHQDPKQGKKCPKGEGFELAQRITEDALKTCPECGGAIRRLISKPYIRSPQSDSDLKSMGFTKLVKRDQGVYENVTRTGGESRYMESGKPETMPHLQKKISD